MIGKRFGMLTVQHEAAIDYNPQTKRKSHKWYCCKCDCGNHKVIRGYAIKNGNNKSCGCLLLEQPITHGMSKTPTYASWQAMKSRCLNTNQKSFLDYGKKGIEICTRWINSFEAFLEDMGERPKGCTLDRIDFTKGYYKENCRWATYHMQSNNRRLSYSKSTRKLDKLLHRKVSKL